MERAPNWKPAELNLLLDKVLPNVELLSGELMGNEVTNKKWQQKWNEITNAINTLGIGQA